MLKITFKANCLNYDKIGKLIEAENLIIYPTDTVYGIGAKIGSESALKKIYEAKSRDFKSPLIALVSDKQKIYDIAIVNSTQKDKIDKLMDKFWPGGLTIILPKKDTVPEIMVSGGSTVGVRMPDHQVALKIIAKAGGILPTTSANISGQKTPTSYIELSEEFKKRVDIIVDGGKCPGGVESTIIDMSKDEIKILRFGAISQEEIEEVIGKI